MKKALSYILKSIPVVLFIFYYVGNTAFIHTHTFSNYTVTHSHPFIPGSHHSHNGEEVETIALFNAFLALAIPLAVFVCHVTLLRTIFHSYSLTVSARNTLFHQLRAPPAL